MITHIDIDIEGTTSSTWFVQRTLYPYSRERFAEYLATHRDRPDVDAMVQTVQELANEPDAGDSRVVWWLEHWLDGDQKMTSELGVPPDRIVFLSDLSDDTPKLVTA